MREFDDTRGSYEHQLYDLQLTDSGMFTEKEEELLRFVLQGITNGKVLAKLLGIAVSTEKNLIQDIFHRIEDCWGKDPASLHGAVFLLGKHGIIRQCPRFPAQEEK